MRTIAEHRRHCLLLGAEMPNRQRTLYSKRYGINRLSVLNNIDEFDICQCVPVDVMHIVCEGSLPYAIKGFLSSLVSTNVLTVNELNGLIKNFQYRSDDKKNSPSMMERTCFAGLDTGKIGQSGECFTFQNTYRHAHCNNFK